MIHTCSQALLNAGPVGITWGWWIAVIFVTFIGLALSEICSSFPVGYQCTDAELPNLYVLMIDVRAYQTPACLFCQSVLPVTSKILGPYSSACLQTTGSLYYWAANLAGPKYGPFASWMTVSGASWTVYIRWTWV